MNFKDQDLELIRIVTTFLTWASVIIGWVVTDNLTKRRDVESQKLKIRTIHDSYPNVSKTTSSNWAIISGLSCPSVRIKRVLSSTLI
jgi:hypothetical protein